MAYLRIKPKSDAQAIRQFSEASGAVSEALSRLHGIFYAPAKLVDPAYRQTAGKLIDKINEFERLYHDALMHDYKI